MTDQGRPVPLAGREAKPGAPSAGRQGLPGRPPGLPARLAGAPVDGPVAGPLEIGLDRRLRGRFADVADGRVLVIDFLVTRPAPHLPTAELSARWEPRRPAGFTLAAPIEDVAVVVDPRLERVLREAGPRLRPVAAAILGQLAVDLERPLAWLDFLSSPAARRP